MGVEFLTEYFKTEVSYIPSILHIQLGYALQNQYVMSHIANHLSYADFSKRFIILGQSCQGTLQLKILLKCLLLLTKKPTLTDCDLQTFSHRLAIFLCLTIAPRDQAIKCLSLDSIKISGVVRSRTIEQKTLKDIELCVVAYLKQYIKITAPLRNTGTNQ